VGICQPTRCGCQIQSSTLTVTGDGEPFIINGINPYLALESALPGAGVRFVGMHVQTTDTLRHLMWNGTIWEILSEPIQSYTPVLGGVGWALGAGTSFGSYQRTRKRVDFAAILTLGAGATVSANAPTVSLPVNADVGALSYTPFRGTIGMSIHDNGVTVYDGRGILDLTTVTPTVQNTAATWSHDWIVNGGGTTPHAWVSGDQIVAAGWFWSA
jgi:hypothetical protein